MSTVERAHPSKRKSQLVRLTIAVTFSLLAGLISLGGVLAKRHTLPLAGASAKRVRAVAQSSPSPIPNQTSRGASPYPDSLPRRTSQAFAPENTTDAQVYINFDDVQSGTIITSQYPP